MIKLVQEHVLDAVEARAACCQTLIEEAEQSSKIVAINCDLASPMGMKPFIERFPERSINVGIAEANACSVAGGMASAGMIPFVFTFAVFASRRIYDQIFMSGAYQNLNIKIIGGDAGVSSSYNGGTHMAFEDVGILRVMPNVTIVEPSDNVMMKALINIMAETDGVFYMRTSRKNLHRIYDETSTFELGRANTLREGSDVTILAYGLTVYEALKAADTLGREGIHARVVDMFTIKPIDRECILESAEKTGALVTAENHQKIGGLGSAVAEVLSQSKFGIPLECVGVADEFGVVGTQDYLMERFRLTAPHIVEAAHRAIARK